MSNSAPNCATLTTQILASYIIPSPPFRYGAYIKDLLTPLFSPALPFDQLSYLTLVLSIKTHELATSSSLNIQDDELQMEYDMAETGTRYSAALKVVKQGMSYVVLKGGEGENQVDAMRLFVDEVERVGDLMVGGLGTGGGEGEGE